MSTSEPSRLAVARSLLAATGFGKIWVLFAGALALVVLFPGQYIETMGPITLQPKLSVITFAPLLLALAVSIAHGTAASPVVRRNLRAMGVRAGSDALALLLALVVIIVSAAVSGAEPALALVRNTLWLAGLALLVSALMGVDYAWLPLVLAFGFTVVSSSSNSDWTPYGMLFRPWASPTQLAVSGGVLALGLIVHIWNPRNHDWLRRTSG